MKIPVAEFLFSRGVHRYLTDKKYKGRKPSTDRSFALVYVNKEPYALKLELSRYKGVGSVGFYLHLPQDVKVDNETHTFMPGTWTEYIFWLKKGLYGKKKYKVSNGGWLWIKVTRG